MHNDSLEGPMGATYNGQQLPLWSKERLTSVLTEVSREDIPWAIRFLVDKLVDEKPRNAEATESHVWDSYQLSPEILAMMPPVRQRMAREYKESLTNIVEKKYK